jgi:hypothetical protein
MSSIIESLKAPKDEILVPFLDMMMRSAPDSLFMGTLLLAIVTQSYSLTVFMFVMAQIAGIQNILGRFTTWTHGVTGGPTINTCSSQIPSWTKFSFLEFATVNAPFPSAPVFFISSVIAFLLGATINTRGEMDNLSKQFPEMKARFPISTILSIVFLVSFILWRILSGCDNLLQSFGSVLFGFITGTLLLLLNIQIFGREAINFAGLPLLVNRIKNGQPLYVCSETE